MIDDRAVGKHSWRRVAGWLACATLVACGGGAPDEDGADPAPAFPTASGLGEQTVLTTDAYLAAEPYASADPVAGERAAAFCRACHTLGEGEQAMLGPNLYGIFGREAGTVPGYNYSEVLKDAGFVWTPRALDAWLAQPARFLPGNRMAFAGVSDAGARADLIAYLLTATGEGGN